MSNVECRSCPINLWCKTAQLVEPRSIAHTDTLLAEMALDDVRTEILRDSVGGVRDQALQAIEAMPALDEHDFVEQVATYAVVEHMITDAEKGFDADLRVGSQITQDLSTRREKSARRFELAQLLEPYVENGCQNGPVYRCARLLGKKTLRQCGAAIPQDLLTEQQANSYD